MANNGLPFFKNILPARFPLVPQLKVEYLDGDHHLHLESGAEQVAVKIRDFLLSSLTPIDN
jgi:hypothetical protein